MNMHIMFTDKLSKMVASTLRKFVDMISSDMILENEHLFWQNTSWSSGEESTQYYGPTGRKNPECNSKQYQQPNVRASTHS